MKSDQSKTKAELIRELQSLRKGANPKEITDRRHTEATLQQSIQEMTVLNTLGQQVSSNLSLDQVVQLALEGIFNPLKPDLALLFLRDKNRLFIKGEKFKNPKFRHKKTKVHKVGECLCGLAVREKKAMYSINIHKDPRCTWRECKEAGFTSFAALPLRSVDKIIGVIGLGSVAERDFSELAAFLETLSSTITIGLQNAIFYEQQKDIVTKLEQEVADRKQAEETLREREQQLSQIYDSVGLVLFYIAVEPDDCFRFRSVNQVFLDATGLVEDQIVGKRIEEVIPEPAVSMVRNNYKKAIEEKRIIRWEETTDYPTGIKVGEVSIAPVFHNGICNYLVGSVHDITARKQAEEDLKIYQQRLEEKVDKRTAELEASNKELEAFAYSVSHDLRSPLRAINGFSQIIASRHRAGLKEEGRHYFDNIVEASTHMGVLIEDLLKYSQLGRKTVDIVSTQLGGIWEMVTDTFSERIAETNAQIDLSADLPAVMGNRILLIQIFSNLLDNALLYHKPGKPPQIKVKRQLDDGYVIISVSDKGIGIAPEYHGKIFDVFQRLHQQAEYPGTGIGLAIVKKAVALLKGALWVESAPGKGSTFYVKLPLQNDD